MPASRRVVDLSPTPFGTGCQTLEGVGVKVWVETLQNELRDQMKHWAKNNGGTNPLEEPLPRSLSDSFSLKSCPKNLPRSDPPLTKVPIQIRDPTYTVMDSTGVPVRRDRLGRPAPAPKFYSGAIQRHAAPPRRPRDALLLPGVNHGFGGYRTMTAEQQRMLFNYPPPFPGARISQATVGSHLPHNSTFNFGLNFDRAKRDAPAGSTLRFRPLPLDGEVPLGMLGRADV
eukprot:TRINITY_DN3757_c0_g1_i4.p1 TRINITY_DN3757_c0_g1~~TRINITY_DN3757_c0_g1_i4.p1  ORF type:complete len:229 (-),score=33.50 TRINITY_DN3757_c0_g1_i4:17-703(-)